MTADLRAQLQSALGAAYTVERELGGGGMSRVFVAIETTLGRRVVVKVLPPELAAELSVERFRREIQVAAQLQNPRIVPLLAAGEAGGLMYFTMPLVEGESLRARLARDGELPVRVAVQVMRDIAKALAHAHQHGVVHRDIKPENILLAAGDALVTDFGVAKAVSASTTSGGGLTSVGLALGTPAYMAPEQAAGDAGVDHRADLYALGAVAYEMLTGQGMFAGRSPQALLAAQATETPEAIERRRPNLPASLAALVTRLLAKRPADRPQTADEVLREMEMMETTLGAGVVAASPTSAPARTRPTRRLLATAVVVTLAIGAVVLVFARRAGHAGNAAGGETQQASVAVLPLVDLSADRSNEFFSDGLTEELIDRLANVRGLRVAARTSSFAFKGKVLDVGEIGRQLHVRNLVEGSVRRSGSRIKVTAQLVDADNGYHRWSHTYDGDLNDVFAVQEQIGTAIVAELKITLAGRDSAALARAPTRDTLAHTLYLQARSLWNRRSGESMPRAIELFERAIARDSTYADAWGGLAECYAVLPAYVPVSIDFSVPKTIVAADRALALDGALASAHTARALALRTMWRWGNSEQEFRTAIALNPNYATAHEWFSPLLLLLHKEREALAEARRAVELDPLSLAIDTDYGTALYRARRFDDAEAQLRATLGRDPSFAIALSKLGLVLVEKHQADSAIAVLRRAVALEEENASEAYLLYLGQLGLAYAKAGLVDSAVAVMRALQKGTARGYVSSAAVAIVQLGLGEGDQAVASIMRAMDKREPYVTLGLAWALDPYFDGLRTRPRYRALLKRVGLS